MSKYQKIFASVVVITVWALIVIAGIKYPEWYEIISSIIPALTIVAATILIISSSSYIWWKFSGNEEKPEKSPYGKFFWPAITYFVLAWLMAQIFVSLDVAHMHWHEENDFEVTTPPEEATTTSTSSASSVNQ